MEWVILISAGAMEAVWALALAESNGLKKWKPSLIFGVASVLSLVGLAVAMRAIPTGTAYAVWTGIGAALTVLWSILSGKEKATTAKLLLLLGLVACIVGLKLVH
ncbi:DMT family transporter [Luethyella okanaganae]|uniref:DMT family transporter n=1 Tax=Luethyella okanaganae TaxID=69372 RepID=A0ABW1VF67_9MICO